MLAELLVACHNGPGGPLSRLDIVAADLAALLIEQSTRYYVRALVGGETSKQAAGAVIELAVRRDPNLDDAVDGDHDLSGALARGPGSTAASHDRWCDFTNMCNFTDTGVREGIPNFWEISMSAA